MYNQREMDFRFNINNLLPKKINKITHTLIPEGFRGDRREYNECQRLLTRILDDIGEASARAQGLNRTITSAVKLRDTDHIIYLMVDNEGNSGLGSVVGLLKTGSKTLFMFDENGLHYRLTPRCILDFYIHETRQRMGLGIELYQHMLAEEDLKPIKLAIDRPSDKFLAFLMKHYGLSSIITQNNKFVVFKGFFDDEVQDPESCNRYSSSLPSPHRQQSASERKTHMNNNDDLQSRKDSSTTNGSPIVRSAYGRYAATRPPCSMASIIHNSAADQSDEQMRITTPRKKMFQQCERPQSLNLLGGNELPQDTKQSSVESKVTNNHESSATEADEQILVIEHVSLEDSQENKEETSSIANELNDADVKDGEAMPEASTGPDDNNASNGVESKDAPLTTSQETADVDQPLELAAGITDGHLDLKFYHSPLW